MRNIVKGVGVAAAASTLVVVGAGAALAGGYPPQPPSPSVYSVAPSPVPVVAQQPTTAPQSSSLPFTGADVVGLTVVGVVLIAGGAGAVALTRRRRA